MPSSRWSSPPCRRSGALLLNGVAVTAGQEVLASDIAAGKLTYLAPSDAGGAISFDLPGA
jgi:hypothetical protein